MDKELERRFTALTKIVMRQGVQLEELTEQVGNLEAQVSLNEMGL